jgi:FKBP-type peptidyl-prolyl cis-trans isomerase
LKTGRDLLLRIGDNMRFIVLIIGGVLSLQAAWGAEPAYTTDAEKLGYAIGYQVGTNLIHNLKRDDMDIDVKALTQAIEDVLAQREPRLSAADRQEAVQNYRAKVDKKRAELADKNKQAGNKFLAENKTKEGVKETASGLQYRIITAGHGKQPQSTDTVVVHYRGSLLDGNEFDSSYKRNKPATLPLSGVIKGWQEALPLMKEGAKWELYIPPELAYGARGSGSRIAPNQTLVFEVELLEVR